MFHHSIVAPQVSRPLSGVIVVDAGQQFAAPYATLLLALAGADVIKVEPRGGEALRRRDEIHGSGAGIPFHFLNANKRSVTLDLKQAAGRQLFLELADRAAVVVENYRPGVLDRLGVGPDVLRARNPSIIVASGSG
jgi:formyl-CoA transferase